MEEGELTRRAFSAMAAAPLANALSSRIRTAVVGTGHGHALSKIRALRSMPEYELAGVCRPDPNDPPRNPEKVEALRGVQWLSIEQVLEDASIEMVAIESADFDRNLEYAERFVRAGRFVHFDKPPGEDLARLRTLLGEAAKRKRVVQMGYQWRYHPAMQAAVEAARKGWLGRLYRFRASIDKLVQPEERAQLARHRGGLMFSEGCHLVDRAVAVFGKPAKATGFLRHDSTIRDGLADNTLAVLEYEHAIAEISLAGFHEHGTRYRFLEIFGTNGFARVQPYSFPSHLTVDLTQAAGPYKAGAQIIETRPPAGLPYTPDLREMAAIIRRGEPPAYSAEHDLITHETLLRVCGMLS
jgi:predicted dehydrogenase